MPNEPAKAYPDQADITEEGLDPNSSYSKMLGLVGESARVLDVGCASGYLARLMLGRGCRVWGVDINPEAVRAAAAYCESAVVADLDSALLTDIFVDESFDVIVFGDVLEHLRNPCAVLDDARKLLNHRGHVVASIPNIAHGAVRLALLGGRFEYSEFGILDNTHLRFFTRDTVEELFFRGGYRIERIEQTKLPLFGPTNLAPAVSPSDYDESVIRRIRDDPDVDTLQFVVRAKALTDIEKEARGSERSRFGGEAEGGTHDAGEHCFTASLEMQLEEERQKSRDLQSELQAALSEISANLESTVHALEARFAAESVELQLQRFAYDELFAQATTLGECLRKAHAELDEMRQSKFWKLRELWRRLKR